MFEYISDSGIRRYLGAPRNAVIEGLEDAKRLIVESSLPKYVCGTFKLTRSANGISLVNTSLTLTGKAIAALLAGCERCGLIAVTLGKDIDRLISRTQTISAADAALLNAAASGAAESLMEFANRELAKEHTLTGRFSVGYGDLPLTLQPALLSALNAERRIGVVCNAGGLMVPIKSVTAIVGIKDCN